MVPRILQYSVALVVGLGGLAAEARPTDDAQTAVTVAIDEKEPRADPDAPIEIVQERYPNGAVKIRREVTLDTVGNYILHGQWTFFDTQGNQIGWGEYQNNKRVGGWTRLHEAADAELFSQSPFAEFEAPFTSQATFVDGKLDGKWVIFDNQKRKVCQWEYKSGVRHGLSTWHYASGKTMRQVQFEAGLLSGPFRAWDQDGNVVSEETYQNGRKLAPKVEYFDNGRKKSEGMYLYPQFVIQEADDWWNARPVAYRQHGGEERHGRYMSWYASGQKQFEGVFQHEQRDGEFSWWYPHGQLGATGSYKDGRPNSTWVWWHDNGQKATQGQYQDGELVGQWSYWTAGGKLRQKVDYAGEPSQIATEKPATVRKAEATSRARDVGR